MSRAMTQQLAKQHGLRRVKTKQHPSSHAIRDRTLSHRSPSPPSPPRAQQKLKRRQETKPLKLLELCSWIDCDFQSTCGRHAAWRSYGWCNPHRCTQSTPHDHLECASSSSCPCRPCRPCSSSASSARPAHLSPKQLQSACLELLPAQPQCPKDFLNQR